MMRLSLTRMVECTQGKLTWSLLSLMEKESQFTRTNRSMWDIGAMDSFMGREDSLGLMDHGMKEVMSMVKSQERATLSIHLRNCILASGRKGSNKAKGFYIRKRGRY